MKKYFLLSLMFTISTHLRANTLTENDLLRFCSITSKQNLLTQEEFNYIHHHKVSLIKDIEKNPTLVVYIKHTLQQNIQGINNTQTMEAILSLLIPKNLPQQAQKPHRRFSESNLETLCSTSTGVLELYFAFIEEQDE